MRVTVVNVNRSGSTNFAKGLSSYFGLKYYPSPFRDYILHQPKDIEFYKNNPNVLHMRTLNHTYESLSEVIQHYDNIVLLSRRDLVSAIESWAYVSYMRDNPKVRFGTHNTKYVWEKTPNYEEVEQQLNEGTKILQKLSDTFNVPITYYEDLYYTSPKETVERLGLGIKYDKFKQYLNTGKRQRRDPENKSVI